MKLFKFEIRTKKKRRELDVLVHADSPAAAHEHLEKRFAGHEVLGFTELPEGTKHFVIAELEPEEELIWTNGKPQVPGWYWYRGDYDAISAGVQPVVVYVERTVEGKPLEVHQPFMDYADGLEALPGEWCGPIEPPPS